MFMSAALNLNCPKDEKFIIKVFFTAQPYTVYNVGISNNFYNMYNNFHNKSICGTFESLRIQRMSIGPEKNNNYTNIRFR